MDRAGRADWFLSDSLSGFQQPRVVSELGHFRRGIGRTGAATLPTETSVVSLAANRRGVLVDGFRRISLLESIWRLFRVLTWT